MLKPSFSRLVLPMVIFAVACSGQVQKDEKPLPRISVKSVLILNFPSSTVAPKYYDGLLTSLAIQLHRKYGVRVTNGISVGRGIWGSLNHLRENACRIFTDRIRQAKNALTGLRIGKSLELCEQALSLWDMCCSEQNDTRPLSDLYTTYGLALLSRERKDDAMKAFRQLAALAPLGRPDDLELSQDQNNALALAYKQELSGNPTQVKVISEPQGATVVVDGKKLGQTPLSTVNLFPGRHCVRLEMEGRGTWTSNLPSGVPPALIQAWLTPAWEGSPPEALWQMTKELNPPGDEESAQLQKAAKLFKTDAVIVVKLEKTDSLRLTTLLFIPGIGVASPWEEFDLGPGGKGLAKRLYRMVGSFSQLKSKPSNSGKKHAKSNNKKKKKKNKKRNKKTKMKKKRKK